MIKRLILILLLASTAAFAQYSPLLNPHPQFFAQDGTPLAGGKVYTYSAGTTTPLNSYTDSTGVTPNSNPIILDSAGYPPAGIWLGSTAYKFVVKDASDVTQYTMDNISGPLLTYIPGVSGTDFGSSTLRWNGFFTGVDAQTVNTIRFADKFASIQAAVDDLPASGGMVLVPAGTYNLSTTLTISKSNVYIKCIGGSNGPPLNATITPTPTCALNWAGAVGGTMVQFASANDVNTPQITRDGMSGFYLQCHASGNSAGIGLQLLSASYGRYEDLTITRCTTAAVDMNVVANTKDLRTVQYNTFSGIAVDTYDTSTTTGPGAGFRLDGDSSANTSENTFSNIYVTHYTGDGIQISNADNDTWTKVTTRRLAAGTGIGIHLAGAGTVNTAAREESFFGADPGSGGVTQDGTADGNLVYGMTLCNGSPLPTVTNGHLAFSTLDCGGVNDYLAGHTKILISGAATPQLQILSGSSASAAQFEIGRTAAEHILAAVQGAGNYFTDAQAGDLAIRTNDNTKAVRIGVGSGDAQLRVTNSGVAFGSSGSSIADSRELIQSAHSCGTTATCSNTANGSNRIVFGTAILAAGTVTVSGISPAFTSTTSFICVGTDQTSAAAVKIANASTSSFTITGTGTDVVGYQCVGN